MVTMIAAREEVATEIDRRMVFGKRVILTSVSDGIELRHQVHKAQPAVVFIDELLSTEFNVLAAAKRLDLVRSCPRAVLITDEAKKTTLRRAKAAGFHLVLERRRGWEKSFCAALAIALAAQRSKLMISRAASGRGSASPVG
jgi:DNA-binding NarL/FixJ family response regulator